MDFEHRQAGRAFCGLLLSLVLALLPAKGTAEDPAEEVSRWELEQADAATGAIAADETLNARAKLDRVFKSYATMGACVAVIHEGEIVFTHTYGTRMRGRGKESDEPVTEDTLFQVGSISKMVAGIGLLCLVEDGMAELDSDLSDLFGFPVRNPAYPDRPITLRQLMSHTAGLRDSGHYQMALDGNARPLSSLFRGNAARFTFLDHFRSGANVQYSNFGGGVAGSLIEALSGQTVDQYLTRRVFLPLGITAGYQASLLPRDMKLANMYAMPSRRLMKEPGRDPAHIISPAPEYDYFLTAGKLLISSPDLAKILIMLCDGGVYGNTRILKASTAWEMRRPQNFIGSVVCASNRGLFMNVIVDNQVEGRVMYGHGGKAYGMLCAAYFDPADRTGVVMLTNGCNNRKVYNGVGMLGRAVMRICYGELLDGKASLRDPWLVEE
ncbi:MAG: beta-lactamase family protein [Clostridia bacterium]|nr:beta-lactamase family protein [Clostridia bacterium]